VTKKSAIERDEECIGRAQRRLVRAYKRLGTWRAVGAELGINHGNVVALTRHGTVPRNWWLRVKLGLPMELPSEKQKRILKVCTCLRPGQLKDGMCQKCHSPFFYEENYEVKMETMTIEQYRELLERSGQKSKMKNVRTEVDGFVFQSGLEANRYAELKILEKAGEISDLQLQVPFSLSVNGVHICKYVADFVYRTGDGGRGMGEQVVEDAKGRRTAVYSLKKNLMLAILGIEIIEILEVR